MLYVVLNENLAHVVVTDETDVLLQSDVHPSEAAALVEKSIELKPIDKDFKELFDSISYHKAYKVYVFGEIAKKSAAPKIADPKPVKPAAKKAAAKK